VILLCSAGVRCRIEEEGVAAIEAGCSDELSRDVPQCGHFEQSATGTLREFSRQADERDTAALVARAFVQVFQPVDYWIRPWRRVSRWTEGELICAFSGRTGGIPPQTLARPLRLYPLLLYSLSAGSGLSLCALNADKPPERPA